MKRNLILRDFSKVYITAFKIKNMPKHIDGKMASFVLSEEQTLLSKQRTALSFMQTGLVFIGVGLTVAKLFSEIFFQGIGILLIMIGFYEIAHSYKKLGEYNQRLKKLKKVLRGSKYAAIEYGLES